MEEQIRLQNLVFDLNEENAEEIKRIIKKMDFHYVVNLFYFSSNKNIFKFKILGDILAEYGKISDFPNQHNHFHKYLTYRGLIENIDIESENCEEEIAKFEKPLENNKLLNAIFEDDVLTFSSLLETENVDISTNFFQINGTCFSPKEFAFFCGSLNIVKKMFLNGERITENMLTNAVKGGNEALIDFLQSKGFSFDFLLTDAIMYHNNSVAMWIYENYHNHQNILISCVLYYNTELLIYFLEECGLNINAVSLFLNQSCLHIASSQNNYAVAKYLISEGINKELRDLHGHLAFDLSNNKAMQTLLQ